MLPKSVEIHTGSWNSTNALMSTLLWFIQGFFPPTSNFSDELTWICTLQICHWIVGNGLLRLLKAEISTISLLYFISTEFYYRTKYFFESDFAEHRNKNARINHNVRTTSPVSAAKGQNGCFYPNFCLLHNIICIFLQISVALRQSDPLAISFWK